METVFLRMVTLSLTASIMVVVILAIRLVFRRAPKWMFCLLWGLVALRLIFPCIIESRVSLIPTNYGLISAVVEDEIPDIPGSIVQIGNEAEKQAAIGMQTEAQIEMHTEIQSEPQTEFQIAAYSEGAQHLTKRSSITKIDTINVISYVWLGGVAAMAAYMLLSYVLLRRRLRTATWYTNGVKQSEFVNSPFLLGIIRPTIYIPYNVDREVLNNVIAHEKAHISRRDHWWKPLGFVLLSVYWFNPFMWLAYVMFTRDIEAACDEKVIKDMDKDGLQLYSSALLNFGISQRKFAACPLTFGEVDVKERVKNVMNYKKPAFRVTCLSIIAVIAVAVLFLTNRESENTDYTPEKETQSNMAAVNSSIPGTDSNSDTDYYIDANGKVMRMNEEEQKAADEMGILLRDRKLLLGFLEENIHISLVDEKTVQFAPDFGKRILIRPVEDKYCTGVCSWDCSVAISEQISGLPGAYEMTAKPLLVAQSGQSTDAYSPTVRLFLEFTENGEYRILGYIIESGAYSVDVALYEEGIMFAEPVKEITVDVGDAQIHAYVKAQYPNTPERNKYTCVDLLVDGDIVDSRVFEGDDGWIYSDWNSRQACIYFVEYSVYNGIYSVNDCGRVYAEGDKLRYIRSEAAIETYGTITDKDGNTYPYYEVYNPRANE